MSAKMGERIVKEESLVTVADAIRAKGGTSDPLSFPTGFSDAISAIQAGGGMDMGTMTFSTEQNASPAPPLRITHNLGKAPNNILWFVESTSSVNTSGMLVGGYKSAFAFVSPIACANAKSASSSTSTSDNIFYRVYSGTDAQNIYKNAQADESGVNLFFAYGIWTAGTIPAGSTIRWIVW